MNLTNPAGYNLGGSPDLDYEDALLDAIDVEEIRVATGGDALLPLGSGDVIDPAGLSRTVKGFSLGADRFEIQLEEGLAEQIAAAAAESRARFEEEYLARHGGASAV